MQSPQMQDLDWQALLGLDRLDPNANLSPLSNQGSDASPLRVAQRTRPRNRNPRSCDFCRIRKTACIIENDVPCMTCRARGLECTFTKRRRGGRAQDEEQVEGFAPPRQDATPISFGHPLASVSTHAELAMPWQTTSAALPPPPEEDAIERRAFAQQGSPDPALETHGLEQPLDQPSGTFLLLGDSGEADPHLLKRSSLAAHADNLRFRRLYRDQNPVNGGEDLDRQRPLVFMLGADSLYNKSEPRIESDELRVMQTELDRISKKVGIRLVQLYFKYVYPYFPVLSRSRMLQDYGLAEDIVSELPLSLKAVLYACALPYMVYDDVLSTMLDLNLPTAKTLYRICWTAITQEIHTPRLSTMQACLLLLQRDNIDRYVQGSPFQWSLMAWTVSLAQTLGLSTDCSTVRGIPAWEKRLRKRLWWATYVLDKWNFSLSGLTSHIRNEDFDVLPLTNADFVSDGKGSTDLSPDTPGGPTHLQLLVDLTVLLSDTTDTFFTVRACKATGSDFTSTRRLANDLQSKLQIWKESFNHFTAVQTPGRVLRTRLDGNASLHLAYWAVRFILFRAMLRSLTAADGSIEDKQLREECREAVRHGAKTCCVEVVDFVENLPPGAWNAFWHKFSPSNFAMTSSVMMRLLVTSCSPGETNRLNELIERWRWVLRSGGGNVGGVLMSLGLLRLDRTLLNSRDRESCVIN